MTSTRQPITAETCCTVFWGSRRFDSGRAADVLPPVYRALKEDYLEPLLIFDDHTGAQLDFDLSGTIADVLARLAPPSATDAEDAAMRGPGRPKLGVVPREVTLLPRHWDWLNGQPGGASVALRKLVEEALRANRERDRIRQAQEAAYRFMSALAGNEPGFEEASRALFAADSVRFERHTHTWPPDVRDYARTLAAGAFTAALPRP